MTKALAIRREARPGGLIRAADAGTYVSEPGSALGPVRRVEVRPRWIPRNDAVRRAAGRYREVAALSSPVARPVVTVQV